ncbi:MAG: polymer-forming cytoskeletal protein [Tepidisphaeraceae bacterium]|jgi:hypothetical protein
MALPLEPIPGPHEREDRVSIVCLHCRQAQQVARRALTVTCRHCHKSLRLEDLPIKDYHARRSIETCGIVTVEKKGNVVADRVLCGGMIVRGKVKAKVISYGPVLVGPEAEINGDITAPSLAVGAGAILEGQYAIGSPE